MKALLSDLGGFLLFLIILVVLYLLLRPKHEKQEWRKKIEEQIRFLEHRRKRLKKALRMKQEKLEWVAPIHRNVKIVARLIIAGILGILAYSVCSILGTHHPLHYLAWFAALPSIPTVLLYITLGIRPNTIIDFFEIKIKKFVYGKKYYLNLEDRIQSDMDEIELVTAEIDRLNLKLQAA